jgi:hypothetical protein
MKFQKNIQTNQSVFWFLIALIGLLLVGIGFLLIRQPSVVVVNAGNQDRDTAMQISMNGGGDDRYTRAPEAERDWIAGPDLTRVPNTPFNIPTQGIPESYQSMGLIKTGNGQMLPLYGRRSISSRDRYNYYTRTDTYNPIPIPITIKGRDCQDQVGCPELYDGDSVRIAPTKEEGEVTIYRVRDIIR